MNVSNTAVSLISQTMQSVTSMRQKAVQSVTEEEKNPEKEATGGHPTQGTSKDPRVDKPATVETTA